MPEEASFCLHCFTAFNVTPLNLSKSGKKSSKIIIAIILIAVIIAVSTSAVVCSHSIKNHKDSTISSPVNSITETEETVNEAVTEKESSTKKATTEKVSSTENTSKAPSTTEATEKADDTKNTTKPSATKITTTVKATTASSVIIDGNMLISYPSNKKDSSYTIPDNVKKIANNAFNNNKYITTLKFSKRESVECDWSNLFSNLPNLKTIYVYPGTSADLEGLQYFDGEIVYYD